ncbi:MAG: glycosyltransferase family 87 protein [Terriglobales bacterium]
MKRNRPGNLSWLIFAASLLVCFGIWHWAETILVPANTFAAQSKGVPIGNNSDLYPRWLGARELLLHRRDPYSAEVTRDIQKGFYGRPLGPMESADPRAQESFVYPLYVVFLLAPTVTLPFSTVLEVFRWFLLLGIAASVPVWMYAVGLRFRPVQLGSAMVLAVSSYPAVLEFHMQNVQALVALLLALTVASLVRGRLVLSGFLLALATVKPDTTTPVVLWLLVWAAWRRERWRLIWGFTGSMAIMLAGAQAISPGWMERFLVAVREYPSYGTDPSILQVLFPPVIAKLMLAALVLYVLTTCWRWKRAAADSDGFGWTLALVITVTLVAIPKLSVYNQVLLIPPLLVLFAQRQAIASMGLMPRALAKAAFASQGWQWATAVIISFASLLISGERMRAAVLVPVYTLLALPPLTLLAVVSATFVRQRRSSS